MGSRIAILVLPSCLFAGAITSVLLGQDANWDLWNYHLYNGFSAAHGRYTLDLAAAGLQSWLNPALDIAYSWLALGPLSQHPIILAALMGLWYGSLIFLALMLAVVTYRHFPRRQRVVATSFGTALAITGAAVVSQIGTTTNDLQASTFTMGALFLLARAAEQIREPEADSKVRLALAGTVIGIAAAIKFSYAIYGVAALIALGTAVSRQRMVRSCLFVCTGSLLGWLIAGLWWELILYAQFHNPVFPYFNSVFRSPWYPPASIFDRRFLPRNVWQLLFYPLYWLADRPGLGSAWPFRDARIAVFLVLTLSAAVAAALGSAKNGGKSLEAWKSRTSPAQLFLLVFLTVSYLLWLNTTAILRYAIPVEMSAALVIPLLIWSMITPALNEKRERFWTITVAAVSAAILLTTHYPRLGRAGYGNRVMTADMNWLPANSLVVFVGATSSYLAAFAPQSRSIDFVGLTDVVLEARGFRLADEIVRRIWAHRGPIILVLAKDERWRLPTLSDVGLTPIAGSCHWFSSTYGNSRLRWFETCSAKREVVGKLTKPFWIEAARRYAEIEVPNPVSGWSYIKFAQAVGPLAKGKHYVDRFEYLWSRQPGRPRPFDRQLLPRTLYILDPSLKLRARRAMNSATDLLTEIDGILVLAPRWRHEQSPGAELSPPGK